MRDLFEDIEHFRILNHKSYLLPSFKFIREKMQEEEEIKLLFKVFEKNEEWFNDHYEDLQEKYQDTIIAIKNQEVIEVKTDLEELLNVLEMKGEDINTVFITSIPPKGFAFIL